MMTSLSQGVFVPVASWRTMTQPCGNYSGADALTEAHVQGDMRGVGLWELLDVFPKLAARISLSGRTSASHY